MNTWFLVWRHVLLKTFHRLLLSFVFSLGFEVDTIEDLHHDCAPMLQTSCVLLIENVMIRRSGTTKFVRQVNTVSSCIRAVPARSSGSLRELTYKLHNSDLWENML